ncbi:MAG: CinA family protein [Salinibacterium sp.]|nr:CinA family protein [Salinibacterium sp.]
MAPEPHERRVTTFSAESSAALSAEIVALLTARRQTIAVAESLTGGLLVAELTRTPGASAVVVGGVVAYSTELKHTLLGVNAEVLASHGPVHPDVAAQMAAGVRDILAVAGEPAYIGISTTGVAGPEPQGGRAVGTVFLGFAIGLEVRTKGLALTGTRDEIRAQVVGEALNELRALLG